MGDVAQRFRVNTRDVVHELIDGEVIAIDLGRGSYYSLAGGAVDAWQILVQGASIEELVTAFNGGADRGEVEREMGELIRRLEEEALILPDGQDSDGRPPADSLPYRPPVFEKFDDMQDFFLLDPIHDVGSTGWPRPQGS